MEKVLRLQAEGIMCTGCVEDMQTVLRNTEGINDAKVSFSLIPSVSRQESSKR
jgi:copper chaperone CopZ